MYVANQRADELAIDVCLRVRSSHMRLFRSACLLGDLDLQERLEKTELGALIFRLKASHHRKEKSAR